MGGSLSFTTVHRQPRSVSFAQRNKTYYYVSAFLVMLAKLVTPVTLVTKLTSRELDEKCVVNMYYKI